MDISSIRAIAAVSEKSQPQLAPEEVSERRELLRAAGVINASESLGTNNELVFVVDRITHKAIMRVIDRKTKEVVMQLPAEYVLRLAEDAQKVPNGGTRF